VDIRRASPKVFCTTTRRDRPQSTRAAFDLGGWRGGFEIDDLLQLAILASRVFDFVAGGFPERVSSKLLLTRLEEGPAPSIVVVGGDAFSPRQF
jgi:hypothetical protein